MEDIRNLFDRGDSGAEPEARNAERDVPKEEEADIEKNTMEPQIILKTAELIENML